MKEIPIERLPQALAARIACPAAGCAGVVRLELGMVDGGGDVAVWACASSLSHQWHEDGTPRWSVEVVAELFIVPEPQKTAGRRAVKCKHCGDEIEQLADGGWNHVSDGFVMCVGNVGVAEPQNSRPAD